MDVAVVIKKAWVAGFGTAGGAMTVAGLAATVNPYRWIWLGDRLALWSLLGALGLAMLIVACVLLAIRSSARWRVPLVLAAVVLLAGTAMAGLNGLLRLVFSSPHGQRVVATSADGRFVVVLHETSSGIDPVHGLYVQTTEGPFSKRAYLGCFNYDDPGADKFETARFASTGTGMGTVVIEGSRQWTLRFDAKAVRTIDKVESGFCGSWLYTG